MGARQTRLISRSRYNLRWGRLLRTLPLRLAPFYVLFEPGEFVMLRKMLLGIKSRAQKRAKMLQAAVKAPANSATR